MFIHDKPNLKRITKLGVPIFFTQLAQSSIALINTAMAGHRNIHDLSIIAIGMALWILVFYFLSGSMSALTPIISKYYGENDKENINITIKNAAWVGVVISMLSFVLLYLMSLIVYFIDVDDYTRRKTFEFLFYANIAIVPSVLFCLLRGVFDGLHQTKVTGAFSFFGLLLCYPLNLFYMDYLEFGVMGCVLTIATINAINFLGLLYVFIFRKNTLFSEIKQYETSKRFKQDNFKHILSMGIPIGIMSMSDCLLFSVTPILFTVLGSSVVSAYHLSTTVTSIMYVCNISFISALSILLAYSYPIKTPRQIRRLKKTGYQVVALVALSSLLVMIVFMHPIVEFFTNDSVVKQQALIMLSVVYLYQMLDAWQLMVINNLRALHDTKVPMLIVTMILIGIGIPLEFMLINYTQLGIKSFALTMFICFGLIGLILTYRLNKLEAIYYLQRPDNPKIN